MNRSNPFFKETTYASVNTNFATQSEVMTVDGTINKSIILLALATVTAGFSWWYGITHPAMIYPFLMIGIFGGLIMAFITSFSPKSSPVTAPIYALLEGFFLGAISLLLNSFYPGIVFQAVLLTIGVFFAMFFAYKTGFIQVTQQFRSGVVAATGGIFLVYLSTWILGMFGINIPYIHGSGMIGIGFSLFVVVLAALNLVLDFDFIDQSAREGAPKYMEWFAAFGLIVTLIWLYVEILKLLSKLSSSD